MALVKQDAVQRVEVHDGWIDVRSTATVRDLRSLAKGLSLTGINEPTADVMFNILESFIVAWSYDDPVTPENIELLDMDAATSVFAVVGDQLGVMRKKGLIASEPSPAVNGTLISST